MAADLPTRARVVIVGGGVIGCSVAYHLCKLGWSDIVLLERKHLDQRHHLACRGSRRPAAPEHQHDAARPLHGRAVSRSRGRDRPSHGLSPMRIAVARDHRRAHGGAQAQRLHGQGVRARPSTSSGRARFARCIRSPISRTSSAAFTYRATATPTPSTSPRRSPRARAPAACAIFQDLKVTAIHHDGRRVRGVQTDRGRIDADYVVLCGGMWTRDLAASIGVTVPLHACEHYYVLFQDVPGLKPDMPVLRDYDHCSYFKYDAGKLLVGAFEPHARPWGADGIPDDFAFGEIAGDFSHFEPVLLDAMRRIPALEQAGIQKFFCGPESFTPDVRYHLGESAELAHCFVAAGLNSIGLQSAGGIGKVVSEWIRDGHPPVGSVGGRRAAQHAVPDQPQVPARARLGEPGAAVRDALAVPPVRDGARRAQIRAARPLGSGGRVLRRSVRLGTAPTGTRPPGSRPRYEYSYGRQNWFEHSAREHRAVRDGGRSLRSILVRQVPPRRRRCRARAQSRLRERRRRGAGQDRLHAVAERARRHRGGPHGDAPERDGVS